MVPIYNMAEAAKTLRKSRRWLQDWLRDHPIDSKGQPYCRMAGRTHLFTKDDLTRLKTSIARSESARKRHAKTRPGIVYFLKGGEYIKIGYTKSIQSRMIKASTDSPFDLVLLHFEPGTFKIEKLFHRHFAKHHVRGEWFNNSEEILAFIETRKTLLHQ